jgi:hypothetical protein
MKIRMKICVAIFVTAWVLVHGGCATFKPPSIAAVPFQERAQTQQKNGVRVNAAVLSEKESRAAFGLTALYRGQTSKLSADQMCAEALRTKITVPTGKNKKK